MYLARRLHDGQGRCILTFAEPLDVDRLTRAFRLSLEVEPILGCRFVAHPWRPFWQRREDLDHISSCMLSPSMDIERDAFSFLSAPMSPENDALIQMKLLRGRQDTLCLKISHMVTDGSGLLEYLQLLGFIYKQLAEKPDEIPGYLGTSSRGQGQVMRHAGIRQILRGCLHFTLPVTAWGFPMMSADFSGRTFIVRRIPPVRLDALKTFSRVHQVSLNHVLHTAFYRALFELLDPPFAGPLPIEATVNLRQYLPTGRAQRICNLAGAFFPSLTRISGESFAETVRRVQDLFNLAKIEQPWLGAAMGIESSFVFGFTVADYISRFIRKRVEAPGKMHPFFANFGSLDAKRIDFGPARITDLVMIGPIPYPPASILSVHSFNGAMVLTTGYCHTAIDTKIMQRFLDLFVAELAV
jgi:NRPS condensation-like uncharacterized protein